MDRRETTLKTKRLRLDRKQRCFLINVFEAEQTIQQALDILHIRPQTLRRWLTKPVFKEALEVRMAQYHLQARIEIARCAPMAVEALTVLSNQNAQHESVRKACNDVLKLQHEYQVLATGKKKDETGQKTEKIRQESEKIETKTDKKGQTVDKLGVSKNTYQTPSNPRFQPKNKENLFLPSFFPQTNRFQNPTGGV